LEQCETRVLVQGERVMEKTTKSPTSPGEQTEPAVRAPEEIHPYFPIEQSLARLPWWKRFWVRRRIKKMREMAKRLG
jgi:hypothetical protein